MPDQHYISPRLAEIYDLDSGWSTDRDFYLELAGSGPGGAGQKILDLGCGTGLLCNAYAAKNHDVTGVDPSAAMLDVARRKPHGNDIEWVLCSAQTFRTDKRFDLIIMTGHAFQVLLEDADILQTFTTMKTHLAEGGVIVFESRNPQIDWAKQWDYEMTIDKPGVVESRRFITMKNDRMTFELRYQFADETLTSNSELRFSCREEIEHFLKLSDLYSENVFGDWDRSFFDAKQSLEMIFVVRAMVS